MKNSTIKKKYSEIQRWMADNLEQKCEGCGQPSNLSHSHLISKSICKRKGLYDLIYDRKNIRYHCILGGNLGKPCHNIWEGNDPVLRSKMMDYQENSEFIIEEMGLIFWQNNYNNG
jgi:hypothetical protein